MPASTSCTTVMWGPRQLSYMLWISDSQVYKRTEGHHLM